MWRFLRSLLIVIFLVAMAVSAYVYWYIDKRSVKIKTGDPDVILVVSPGSSARSVSKDMKAIGLDAEPVITEIAFRVIGRDKPIHAGRYLIKERMKLIQIIKKILSGDVMMSKMTIIEGTESRKLLERIALSPDLEHPDYVRTEEEVMRAVGAPKGTHPEGQFAADTFVFAAGIPDIQLLRQIYKEQHRRLKMAWETREPGLELKDPYELLILASIIEKETGNKADRALVSSVFHNRLKKNMPLQTDPTVIYNVPDYKGKITRSHLKTDHPYNTYTRKGLPPTPICNPGMASIWAAAHPAQTDYLYFVAKGDGLSHFSSTLKEHNAAVQKYLRSQGK